MRFLVVLGFLVFTVPAFGQYGGHAGAFRVKKQRDFFFGGNTIYGPQLQQVDPCGMLMQSYGLNGYSQYLNGMAYPSFNSYSASRYGAEYDPNVSMRLAERYLKRSQDYLQKSFDTVIKSQQQRQSFYLSQNQDRQGTERLRLLLKLLEATKGDGGSIDALLHGQSIQLNNAGDTPVVTATAVPGAKAVFTANCVRCHGSINPKGGLSLVDPSTLTADNWSEIRKRIVDPNPEDHMPPGKWIQGHEFQALFCTSNEDGGKP